MFFLLDHTALRGLFKQITCYQKPPATPESSHFFLPLGFFQQTPMKGDTPRNEQSYCRCCRKTVPAVLLCLRLKEMLFRRLKQANSFKGCVSGAQPNLHAYLSPLYLGLSLPSSVKDSGWHGIYFTYRCTRILYRRRRELGLCFTDLFFCHAVITHCQFLLVMNHFKVVFSQKNTINKDKK